MVKVRSILNFLCSNYHLIEQRIKASVLDYAFLICAVPPPTLQALELQLLLCCLSQKFNMKVLFAGMLQISLVTSRWKFSRRKRRKKLFFLKKEKFSFFQESHFPTMKTFMPLTFIRQFHRYSSIVFSLSSKYRKGDSEE